MRNSITYFVIFAINARISCQIHTNLSGGSLSTSYSHCEYYCKHILSRSIISVPLLLQGILTSVFKHYAKISIYYPLELTYSLGVTPTIRLKYLLKWLWSVNPVSSATTNIDCPFSNNSFAF